MAHSVRKAAERLLDAYDEGEDIKGAVTELRSTLEEGPTYVTPRDRFVATLELGSEADSAEEALDMALTDVRDDSIGSEDMQWVVFDRRTRESQIIERGEVE